jgi:hypothetical protein
VTTALRTTSAQPATDKNAPPPVPYPFPVGVYENTTQDYDETRALGATIAAWAAIQMPIWNVSPTGWLRSLWLDFTLTIGGNAATPAFTEDGPWALVRSLIIYDLGNTQVITVTGYEWLCLVKFGGYYELGDPRADITYSVTTGGGATAGSVHFILPVPFEQVARDALGTVQNESKPGWKVEINIDQAAAVYSTQPTAAGTASLRVRGYPESYTEPASAGAGGRPFAQTPPLPGSLAYWKAENLGLPAADTKFDLSNGIGYPIRNIVYINRRTASTRANGDADFPDPFTLLMGAVNLFTGSKNRFLSKMGKDYAFSSVTADSANGRENGVYPFYFTRDLTTRVGSDLRFKYLDTQVNTLIRLRGNFANACTLDALTNWIAVPSRNRYALIGGGPS